MIPAVRRTLAVALIACIVVAVPAVADETITARPTNQFGAATTTIDQGEKVTFRNNDIAGHDVTAKDKGDDGKPLFASDFVAPGGSGAVRGTEFLTTGDYDFFCTIHPGMEARLRVTSAGTPVERPNPPHLRIKISSRDLQRVVKRGKIKLKVHSTKGEAKLTARFRKKKIGGLTAKFDATEQRTLTLKLSEKGRDRLRGRKSAKVTVAGTTTDAAGQTAKDSASRKLT